MTFLERDANNLDVILREDLFKSVIDRIRVKNKGFCKRRCLNATNNKKNNENFFLYFGDNDTRFNFLQSVI